MTTLIPSTYYSFNTPDVNLNNDVQNWATGTPVYDASLNGAAYISRTNYKTGNGSLEFPKNAISTPSSISISNNSNIKFAISSDKLTLVYCGFNGGNVLYRIRSSVTGNWSTDYTFTSSTPNTGSLSGFYSMAMTPDKTFVVFAEYNGYIYFTKQPNFSGSNNSNTYTKTNETGQKVYFSIAISRDGSRIVATDATKIYYADWNVTNYNGFTQTLETKTTAGQYIGISISSNKDRIVYGDTAGKWYLSYWNGSNYNAGTLIYNVGIPRNSFFNDDASLLFLSYYRSNIQCFKFNGNTNSYDYVNTLSMGNYDCHGLLCIDSPSTSNLTIYSLGYTNTFIDYMDLSYNALSLHYCNMKSPTVNTSGFTIACWFRSNYNDTAAKMFDFATSPNATSSNIKLVVTNTYLRLVVHKIASATNNAMDISNVSINDNTWFHLAITMDYISDISSTIIFYINGANKYMFNFPYPDIVSRPYSYLGKSNTLADPQFFGNIDDFRTYNSVLTATDISTLYANVNVRNNYINSTIYLLYSTSVESTTQITPTPTNVGTNQTYYYWNDPYATTRAINNSANPYNFYYTYNNISHTQAKVSVIVNDVFTLKVNGSIQLLISGNTYSNPPQVPLVNGANLFEFLTSNKNDSAYFAAYVTDSNNNYLFSTTSNKTGWNVEISGIYSNGYPLSSLLQNNYTSSTAITTSTNFTTNTIDLSRNYTKGSVAASSNTFLTKNNVDIKTVLFS